MKTFFALAIGLLMATTAEAAEQTFAEWKAGLAEADLSGLVPALEAEIVKKVPNARRVNPANYTYGAPGADTEVDAVVIALEKNDGAAAVASWKKVFRKNNVKWAHAAGFPATNAVLAEVASFWAIENAKIRDGFPIGGADWGFWNTAVAAAEGLSVEHRSAAILSTGFPRSTAIGMNTTRNAATRGSATTSRTSAVKTAIGAGMARD